MTAFLPTLIGLLSLAVVFNIMLCSLGMMGLPFWDAFLLAILLLLTLVWLGSHWLTHLAGRGRG